MGIVSYDILTSFIVQLDSSFRVCATHFKSFILTSPTPQLRVEVGVKT